MFNQSNAIAVVHHLIRHYKLQISESSINEELISHPDYPSLKSIHDSLNLWGIKSFPLRMKRVELYEIQSPFIAHLIDKEEKLVFVPKLNGKYVKCFDSIGKSKFIETAVFFKHYSGVALLIEPDEKSGESNYKVNSQIDKMHRILPYVGILSFLLLLVFVFQAGIFNMTYIYWPFLVTKVIGAMLSFLLVQKKLNIKTKLADAICGNTLKTNCDTILNNNISKVYGWIHWSEVGLIYFLSGLYIMASIPTIEVFSIMSILSISALSFVGYSLYYQTTLKTWCVLCISVQGIFIIEAIFSFTLFSELAFSWHGIMKYVLILITITFFVTLYKAYHQYMEMYKQKKIEYLRLIRKKEIFITLLKRDQKRFFYDKDWLFSIGNKSAQVKVTAFMSFSCEPCKKAFDQLKALFNQESVAIQMIFFLHDNKIKAFVNQLAQLFYENKINEAIKLLDEWYNGKNKYQTIKSCEKSNPDDHFEDIRKAHNDLIYLAEVSSTPLFFVNGYLLPNEYKIQDILYFIEEFKENIID